MFDPVIDECVCDVCFDPACIGVCPKCGAHGGHEPDCERAETEE